MSSENRLGRRGALLGIGLAATGAAAVLPRLAEGDVSTGRAPAPPDPEVRPDVAGAHDLRPADASTRALFGPLAEGTRVEGTRIEALHAPRAGALPVVLAAPDGTRFAVEVFRLDPSAPPPLAQAGGLALYLVNRGDGRTPTPEPVGLGVRALARALDARLASGASIPAALRTQAERASAHPGGVFHVPLA